MKLFVFSVRDSAVDAFMRPFCVNARGQAIRSFQDEAMDEKSEIHKHAADYELFELGTFDEESGKMENVDSPRSVARAVDFLKGDFR